MNGELENKVVIVTGGSRGIGEATVFAVAEAGGKVVIADLRAELGEAVADAVCKKGGEAIFVKADITKQVDVQKLVDTAVSKYGRLDCAFNNAGWMGGPARTADETQEVMDKCMAINVYGTWHCVRAEIKQMLKQGSGGSIVNAASAAGLVGFANETIYTMTKHAIVGLTKVAALDYALDNIRVNALCPGVTLTPLVEESVVAGIPMDVFKSLEPMGRLGLPSELANATIFLLSDRASFVTGHMLACDGGFVAR